MVHPAPRWRRVRSHGVRHPVRVAPSAGAPPQEGSRDRLGCFHSPTTPDALCAQTETHEGRFCSAEHLLDDPQCPVLARLRPAAEQALPAVCSVQQVGDDSFFRLDDARVLAWLSLKVNAVVASLRAGAAAGAAFEALNDEQLTAYAVDLMGEYLAPALLDRLRVHLRCSASTQEGVSTQPVDGHRPSDASYEPDSKRPKAPPPLSTAAKSAVSRLATAKAKNAKAAEGCVNLASLFGKPKPKE